MKTTSMRLGERDVPVRVVGTAIVGAGAAGMACATRLWEALSGRGVDAPHERICVITAGRTLGASRMSGSDKQTYYKMGTSPRVSDSAEAFARTLTDGGCTHGDIALAEALGSLRGFYGLVDAGVPFPHDADGAYIGYKTDHDPAERATSAGPKTSRFMSEALEAKVRRYRIAIIDKHEAAALLTVGEGLQRRIVALACLDKRKLAEPGAGLTLIVASNFVLAAGGPGAVYRDSVYPKGQIGMHGLALAAGLAGVNLTESQYGLASTKFRWNVSGTYMQVVPRIFSTDRRGRDEREFLAEYFPDMPSLATNIFLKGYQWPFDASRIAGHQSSLIDMAVHQETAVRGRRVWMDFLHNPVGPSGWEAFSLEHLGDQARKYLAAAGATRPRPIDRLMHMNPPAIEVYAEHGIDLWAEPLEITVCAQHHNGGMEVDHWWQSSLPGTFVIGEMAGTHGVKRPGGAALNAGQVGAIRAAEYIAAVRRTESPDPQAVCAAVEADCLRLVEKLDRWRADEGPGVVDPRAALARIGELMTCHAAHLREAESVRAALAELMELRERIARDGVRVEKPARLVEAVQLEHQCLTAIAMCRAIAEMLARAAGSRGGHCILSDDGETMHERLIDPLTSRPYRFAPENESLRRTILRIRHDPDRPDLFAAEDVPVRPIPRRNLAFESAWAEFREGRIYE